MSLLAWYIVESALAVVNTIIYSIGLKDTYKRYIAVYTVVVLDWFDAGLFLKFAVNTINRRELYLFLLL